MDRILIVDDDNEIRDLLRILLVKHGYEVFEADSKESLFCVLNNTAVDLIVLDIMLGDGDGLEVCKLIREKSNTPILMISAMGEPADRVLGLEVGADDYIAKPFYSREVVARIKVLLRRHTGNKQEKSKKKAICFAGWELYPESHRLFDPRKIEVSLSTGEYILLKALLNYANRIVTRDQLLSYIHANHEQDVFDRSIDVQICRLRKHMEDNPAKPVLIKTMRGEGYLFDTQITEREVIHE